jgi:glutamate synthase (NADPH/NADH) small chain
VHQFEIMPEPPVWDKPWNPSWPAWPQILRTSSSHEEGCERGWAITTRQFTGRDVRVERAVCARVEWVKEGGKPPAPSEIQGSEFTLDVDLVLIAMGFVHVEHSKLIEALGVALDARGNIETHRGYATSVKDVFVAGDAHAGASLVVRAIFHGREAAKAVDAYLRGKS